MKARELIEFLESAVEALGDPLVLIPSGPEDSLEIVSCVHLATVRTPPSIFETQRYGSAGSETRHVGQLVTAIVLKR
jgi:hypothetical protein